MSDTGHATTLCANCKHHEATQRWVGEGGALAMTHGFYEMWCEGCVLRKQIDHAEHLIARLPDLKRRLDEFEEVHGVV